MDVRLQLGRHGRISILTSVMLAAAVPGIATAIAAVTAVPPAHAPSPAAQLKGQPTVAQILEKNVAARGGLEAWRKIQTLAWMGHMESVNATMPRIAFVLQEQRPNKTRFELDAMNHKTMRVFDGERGWKLGTSREGGPEAQPFTAQEVKFAQTAQVIDGPLIDHDAKGNEVSLEGVDSVEGHKAYRLKVRGRSGEPELVWIDAQTFLELRYDRISYNSFGLPGYVSVLYRNYNNVEGLLFPMILEIGAGSGKVPDRMIIEKIALNPPLEANTFDKPGRRPHQARGGQPAPPGVVPSALPIPPETPSESAPPPESQPR
jgi:hypothetical protein